MKSAARGTRIWCPYCKDILPARAVKPERFGLPRERRTGSDQYHDVKWFRRVRICGYCQRNFVTGELHEDLIRELLQHRQRVAAVLARKVQGELRTRTWLSREETIPLELAEDLVRASAWWLSHPYGPVRAPRHADRIRRSSTHGWVVEFGANSFLVGKALERSKKRILRYYEDLESGRVPSRSEVAKSLRSIISGSVANHIDEEYTQYPSDGTDLVFGAQSIDLNNATDFIIENSGISEFLTD